LQTRQLQNYLCQICDPPTNAILNMMMPSKMNCYLCKGDKFVNDITYFALACINAKGHTITNFTNKCTCITTKGEMTYNRKLCGVTYPSNFILNTTINTFKKQLFIPIKVYFACNNIRKVFCHTFHIKKMK